MSSHPRAKPTGPAKTFDANHHRANGFLGPQTVDMTARDLNRRNRPCLEQWKDAP